MVLIGSISFLEPHRSSKRCALSHKLNLWNILDTNESVLWNILYCVKSIQIRSFFWSAFSCIWPEYGDLLRKSLCSVRIEKNTDQKKLRIWTLFMQCSTLCITQISRFPDFQISLLLQVM